jgi:hypothetical protein
MLIITPSSIFTTSASGKSSLNVLAAFVDIVYSLLKSEEEIRQLSLIEEKLATETEICSCSLKIVNCIAQ